MSRLPVYLFCIVCIIASPLLAKTKWIPIPKEDLELTECKAYPTASAEVLLFNRVLDHVDGKNYVENYKRIKIYNPKGAEEAGILHIDYSVERKLWDIQARLTKADGTTTEFSEDSFSESVVAKTGTEKEKRKSIALPNLAAGDIVELNWSQSERVLGENYYNMSFAQEEVPVRFSSFQVKSSVKDYRFFWFNIANAELKDGDTLEMRNLPPIDREPFMPSLQDACSWIMILYTNPYLRFFSKEEKLWYEISSNQAEEFRLQTKPNQKMKALVGELTKGVAADEEKLERIYDYCRSTVSNFTYFDSQALQTAKDKLVKKEYKQDVADTLSLKSGFPSDINKLFAALARAAGYEVKLVLSGSRDQVLNIRSMHGCFMDDKFIAVKIGADWKHYSPGSYFMPAGMIPSRNELASALYCDEDKVIFNDNPVSPASKTEISREGRFTIDTEGTLEGEVTLRLDGHAAVASKKAWLGLQTNEVEDAIRKGIVERAPSAEITDIKTENQLSIAMPLTISYKVRIPSYAEVAGSRIIMIPNYFEYGKPALFTAETRKYPIFFNYSRTEKDHIEIILPEGYTLDTPTAPSNVEINPIVVQTQYKIAYKGKIRTLFYDRTFILGEKGAIAFQTPSYPLIKEMFAQVNKSDQHSLVLKPKVKAAPAPATGN